MGRLLRGIPGGEGRPALPPHEGVLTVWTDSHCHLPYQGLEDPGAAIERARKAGVTRLVTVGTDLARSQAALAVARAHDGVWATAGLHPHEARHADTLDAIAALLAEPEVVAVGECGLDFHYDHSPRDAQREAFAAQIAWAHEHDLALVIHTREAWDDTFAVLETAGTPERCVFHCFTGGPGEARRALDLGAHLSFSGIVTFKAADDVRGAAALCPLDRLLVETDAPYLAPAPHRGRTNEPAHVTLVGAAVAAAKALDVDAVAAATTANAAAVFGLPAAG